MLFIHSDQICSCRPSFFFFQTLVISQLLNIIFQQFKAQKCRGAPNFRVNAECFAQKRRIWSKTPNFGVTKNSGSVVLSLGCITLAYCSQETPWTKVWALPCGWQYTLVYRRSIVIELLLYYVGGYIVILFAQNLLGSFKNENYDGN